MIKVSVIYPNSDDKSFDMDYYCNKHVPMVLQLLGDDCKGSAVEAGLGGMEPGSPAPFRAMGHLYFDSLAAFAESFGPHAPTPPRSWGIFRITPISSRWFRSVK